MVVGVAVLGALVDRADRSFGDRVFPAGGLGAHRTAYAG